MLIWDIYLRLPSALCNPLIRWRHALIWDDVVSESDFIFVHIPKTAGTAVAHILYGKSLNHYPAWVWYAANPEKFSQKIVFTVLREPLERLISAVHGIALEPLVLHRKI